MQSTALDVPQRTKQAGSLPEEQRKAHMQGPSAVQMNYVGMQRKREGGRKGERTEEQDPD